MFKKFKKQTYVMPINHPTALQAKKKIRTMVNNIVIDGKVNAEHFLIINNYINQYKKLTNNRDEKFCELQTDRLSVMFYDYY